MSDEQRWAELLKLTDLSEKDCVLKRIRKVRLIDIERLPVLVSPVSFCGTDVFQVKAKLVQALEDEVTDLAAAIVEERPPWPTALEEYAGELEAAGYTSLADITGPEDLTVIHGIGPAKAEMLYEQAIGGS
jgi:hypothetical protein